MLSTSRSEQVRREIDSHAFSFIASECFTISDDFLKDQTDLWETWSNLEADRYIKGEYQFRFRRYGRFLLMPDRQLLSLPNAPFYQSEENNSYAGGIARQFAPLHTSTINNRFLAELIRLDFNLLPISDMQRTRPWEIDVHQYRVVGEQDKAGYPTPEGIHNDGFDFFAVHLVKKVNVSGGISHIYNAEQQLLETLTLNKTMDSLIIEDTKLMHSVTPIYPLDNRYQACRDILILNFISKPRDAVSMPSVIDTALSCVAESGILQ